MGFKRDRLLGIIDGFDVACDMGENAQSELLREILQSLCDCRRVLDFYIDKNIISPSCIVDGTSTTIGNIRADLGGFMDK